MIQQGFEGSLPEQKRQGACAHLQAIIFAEQPIQQRIVRIIEMMKQLVMGESCGEGFAGIFSKEYKVDLIRVNFKE